MFDSMRYDILNQVVQEGGLSYLLDQGLVFTQAFAQGSWTYPSVFSFITGQGGIHSIVECQRFEIQADI